tara:strand:+ start:910 stop:1386 length:477 start_codon:yes stop_codon:yes gene_type:complete
MKLESKSLKELRNMYPYIKSTSKAGFIEKLDESRYNGKGLGDSVEKILHSSLLKPITEAIKKVLFKEGEDCGCKDRKRFLNEALKHRIKRCFTESEYEQWGEFRKDLTLQIASSDIKYVCALYASLMDRQYFEPCRNCSPKPLLYMIDSINFVYDSYK